MTGLTTTDILDIVATTTQQWFTYAKVVIPSVFVFAIVVGFLFMAIKWIVSSIRGGGFKH